MKTVTNFAPMWTTKPFLPAFFQLGEFLNDAIHVRGEFPV
jgi:hypothetical protein